MRCKLCDFGLAASEVSGQGTPCYMAPELLRNMNFDEKVDVFAFAVLLWEMFTRKRPFNGYAPMEIRRMVIAGERLPMPSKVGCCDGVECSDPRDRCDATRPLPRFQLALLSSPLLLSALLARPALTISSQRLDRQHAVGVPRRCARDHGRLVAGETFGEAIVRANHRDVSSE